MLRQLLSETAGPDWQVYHVPPEGFRMAYPAIVYKREKLNPRFADNNAYQLIQAWQLQAIVRDADSDILNKLALLPMCTHTTSFVASGLHHHNFRLYF